MACSVGAFEWKKKGQIWAPSDKNYYAKEYGQNPNAVVLSDRIRIYFSSRKKETQSSTGGYISYIFYVDVEKTNPLQILSDCQNPLLKSPGLSTSSEFDEFGTMPGSFVEIPEKNEIWLYYVGWSRPSDFPYSWSNALVVSKDNGKTFDQANKQKILSEHYSFPYLHACPRVYRLDKNNWVMFYAAGTEWYTHNAQENPVYVIKMATSKDGCNWIPKEGAIIPPKGRKECQSSANLIEKNGLYHMFFSYRDLLGQTEEEVQYRIGYAFSEDLINWERNDSLAGLGPSDTGWDSVAVCYPHITKVENRTYMFYSGSQYGSAGFGYAELMGDGL